MRSSKVVQARCAFIKVPGLLCCSYIALGTAHHCVALRRLPGVRIVWDLMLRAPIFYPAFGESRMNEETKLISDRKLRRQGYGSSLSIYSF